MNNLKNRFDRFLSIAQNGTRVAVIIACAMLMIEKLNEGVNKPFVNVFVNFLILIGCGSVIFIFAQDLWKAVKEISTENNQKTP